MKLLKSRHEKLMQVSSSGDQQAAGGAPLSSGPLVGQLKSDKSEWERLVNRSPSPGIYALVARRIVTGPGTFTTGYDAKKIDEDAVPEAVETKPAPAARPGQTPKPKVSTEDETAENSPEQKVTTEEPEDRSEWSDTGSPVQWFVVTDTGLTYYEGRSKLTVMARSLKTGKPLEGYAIQLISANNRVLEERKTGADGVAEFPLTLTQGSNGNRLAAIFALNSDDFSFIDFSRDFFDMSTRGVEGRTPAKDFDAFVYTERGIYRPGETIKAALIVRDALGKLPEPMPPLNIAMRGADGSPVGASQTIKNWQLGGALSEITIPESAPLGSLRLEVRVGSEGRRIGSASVQVAHFKPDRARLAFDPGTWSFAIGDAKASINGSAAVQYLYGIDSASTERRDALVEGATGEVEFLLRKGATPVKGCYAAYTFGSSEEEFIPAYWRKTIDQPSDRSGLLKLAATLEGFPQAKFPLDLNVTVSTFDQSGTLARKTENAIVPIGKPLIGVRIAKSASLSTGEAEFDFLALDAQNQPSFGQSLQVELLAERNDFIYVNLDDRWKPSPQVGRTQVEEPRTIRTGTADKEPKSSCFGRNASTKYSLPPGRYFLKVTDAAGTTSSMRFTVGYSSANSKEPSPDKADIVLSGNGQYRTGDNLQFNIEAPFNGEAVIAISDGDIVGWYKGQTDGRKRASIRVKVPQEWEGKALYAIATVFRPGGEGQGQPGPARALGAVYFEVERGERHRLDVKFDTDQIMLSPDRPGNVPYKLNLSAGNVKGNASAVVFAVDEGILNLTRHKDADPFGYFFGRQALDVGILNSYGRILQGERTAPIKTAATSCPGPSA